MKMKRQMERTKELIDILRLCMVQDYWTPTSSSVDDRVINCATVWGLNDSVRSADWKHFLHQLWVNWKKGSYTSYGGSMEAFHRIIRPCKRLGLNPDVIWPRVSEFREDEPPWREMLVDKVPLIPMPVNETTSDPMPLCTTYIEFHIRQGLWRTVAAKLLHDKKKCLKVLFTRTYLCEDAKRYRQLYATLQESIKLVEAKYFDELLSEDDFTLSEYALDLCAASSAYSARSPQVQLALEAHQQKGRRGHERTSREPPDASGI
ncbi:hypothetical protein MMC11_001082 [Xylographa trunciseda]|nr:hypothetical protein [Xylographa trunciseda]